MTLPKQPIGFDSNNEVFGRKITSWMNEQTAGDKAVYGVFNGGGPKGAAFAGAIAEVESSVRWQSVAGTSAGAITASLLAAGYDGKTIDHISANLDFATLLDVFDREEVAAVARQWVEVADPDWLTALIKDWVPSLLRTQEDTGQLAHRLRERLVSHRDGINTRIIEVPVISAIHSVSATLTGWLSNLTGLNTLDNAVISAGLFVGNDAARERALVNLLRMVLGDQLPPAIIDSVMAENNNAEPELDTDKALAVLLGIYYKAGAYKGAKIVTHIEDFLQRALRSKEDYDLDNPVTFAQMPIELRVMAADISNQRLISFPQGLLDYGYVDDESSPRHYMNYSVAQAVRASMAIPLVFEPVYLRDYSADEQNNGPQYAMLVDGGLLNNFPVNQFNNRDYPVYGFWLGDNLDLVPALSTDRVSGYLSGLINTTMGANDRYIADRMGDDLTLFAIDLDIDLTADERKAQLAQSKTQLISLDEQITANNKVLVELTEQIEIVSDDAELVDFVQNRLDRFKDLAIRLDVQLSKVSQMIDDIEAGRPVTRLTGTLDFSLSDEQIKQLVENGRRAVRNVLG